MPKSIVRPSVNLMLLEAYQMKWRYQASEVQASLDLKQNKIISSNNEPNMIQKIS